MTRRTWRSAALVALTAVVMAGTLAGCTSAPTTVGVSVPGMNTTAPAVSADGRWIAFLSVAQPGMNAPGDLYVYDRTTATTTFVAHRTGLPAISGDGRYVAFMTNADPLGTGTYYRQVFTWDRVTGALAQLTRGNADSGDEDSGAGSRPAISADGTVIAFATAATDVVPGGNTSGALLAVDRTTGATSLVRESAGQVLSDVDLSHDGRYASLIVHARNFPRGTVHRLDRATGTDLAIDDALSASISGDGSRVAYERFGSDQTSVTVLWDAGDGTAAPTTTVDPAAGARYRGMPSISSDGSAIAFARQGFFDGVTPESMTWDVYVWDIDTGTLTQVTQGGRTGWSVYPSMSGDGRTVAFLTTASTVVPTASNTTATVAVWHRS